MGRLPDGVLLTGVVLMGVVFVGVLLGLPEFRGYPVLLGLPVLFGLPVLLGLPPMGAGVVGMGFEVEALGLLTGRTLLYLAELIGWTWFSD